MARYDIETFLRDVETIFKAELNDEIAIINAEKADFDLPDIPLAAFYLQEIPETFSYKSFLVYGIEDFPTTDTQEGNSIRTINVFLEIVIPDDGEKKASSVYWKTLRYMRALEEVARKNFDNFRGRAKIKVDTLKPERIPIMGKMYRTSGIRIKASLNAF